MRKWKCRLLHWPWGVDYTPYEDSYGWKHVKCAKCGRIVYAIPRPERKE